MPKLLTSVLPLKIKKSSKTLILEAPFIWVHKASFITNTDRKLTFGPWESSFMNFYMEILHWKIVRLKFNSKIKYWNLPLLKSKSPLILENLFNAVSKSIKTKGSPLPNWWTLPTSKGSNTKWKVLKTLKLTHLATIPPSIRQLSSAQEVKILTGFLFLRK